MDHDESASPRADTETIKKMDMGNTIELSAISTRNEGQVGITCKVYKRRFIGLAELSFLNLMVAWNWTAIAPVAGVAMGHFHTSLAVVNWFSTSFLLACFIGNLPAAIALRRGPKFSMTCCATIMCVGVWLKYAGTRVGNVALALFGQALCGFSQPFVVNAPIVFAQEWFTPTTQATATAVAFFMSPFGSVVASLVSPQWIKGADQFPSATLWLAIITTASCICAPFIPSRPPSPPSEMEIPKEHRPLLQELKKLNSIPEFHICFWLFTLSLGLYNALASVQWMLLAPFGFSDSSIGLAGALIVVVGLGASLLMSPIADKYGCHLLIMKSATAFATAMVLTFIWVPPSRSTAFCYGVSSVLSVATVGTTAVFETFVSRVIFPLSMEVMISLLWAGGEAMSVILITGTSYMSDKQGTHQPAIYFLAAMAFLQLPLIYSLGMFGREDAVSMKRALRADESIPNRSAE